MAKLVFTSLFIGCVLWSSVCGFNTSASGDPFVGYRPKQMRQYTGSSSIYPTTSPSLYANPIEAIVIGLLAVCGLGFFGIPLLLMLASVFNMNSLATSPGFMPSPLGNLGGMMPTTTTSVNGRRKRKADQLSPSMFEVLTDFIKSQDKMELLQRLIS